MQRLTTAELRMVEGLRLAQGDENFPSPLAGFADRDRETFARLVTLYSPRVTRLAWRLLGWSGDVDDIVQDVFVAVLQQCHKFRGDSDLWPWISTITVNRCRSNLRRQFLRLRWLQTRSIGEPLIGASDSALLRDEVSEKVRNAIRALPLRDREVVVLYYLEDLSVSEISELLRASTNAIDVRLHRARKRLKELLGEFAQ